MVSKPKLKESSPYDSITFGNTLSLRVDGAVGAMTLSPSGRDAALAGRRGLFVIDLDDPFAPPRWLHHITSWEVADVQWSPHNSKGSWVVSTSNQKAMLWNLARSADKAIEHILHKHTRAITDINFHPENPEILATCSIDTFVHSWDLRTPRKPVQSWADWRAGATQVKWNHKNPNIIASSHDNYFYIWDVRKGADYVNKIIAHSGKINGLDYSKAHENEIISCSNDLTVKFWDLKKSTTEPNVTINTDFPVARARHTPFGFDGCGIMPLRGGDNSVYIVNYKNEVGETRLNPSYTFKGHTEPVKDFLWRCRHSEDTYNDDREFQLVTWSKDCDLRLWPVNEDVYSKVRFEKSKKREKKLTDFDYVTYHREPLVSGNQVSHQKRDSFVSQRINNKNNKLDHLDWISGVRIGRSAFAPTIDENSHLTGGGIDHAPGNFGEEVSTVGHKFPKVRFEKISVSTGKLVISLNGPISPDDEKLIFIRVEMNFPKNYPAQSPKFDIEESHELTSELKSEIMVKLNDVAKAHAKKERYCLESCLRILMGERINVFEMLDDSSPMMDAFEIPPLEATSNIEDFMGHDLSSSDEDEEDFVPLNSLASNDISSKPTYNNIPVPKGCGAVWTPSGHLVCFYPPKDTQKLMLFNEKGFSVKKAKLTNFGKMSLGKKLESSNSNNENDNESDSVSSDDSFTNDLDDILQDDISSRAKIPGLFRSSVGLKNYGQRRFKSNLSVPTEKSGTQTSVKANKNVKSLVGIFDFRHLIPAKYELACEYKVLGDSAENLAHHNAQVAMKYGYLEISECWRILEMILTKNIEIMDSGFNVEPATPDERKQTSFPSQLSNTFRFYWGAHPFGNRWLAKELLKYYENTCDIQMLAMLSCVLFENLENVTNASVSTNTPYNPPSALVTPVINRSLKHELDPNHSSSFIASLSSIKPEQSLSVARYSVSGSVSSIEGSVKSLKSSSPERHSYLRKGIPTSFSDVAQYSFSMAKSPEDFIRSDLFLTRISEVTRRSNTFKERFSDNSEANALYSNPFTPPKVQIEMIDDTSLDLHQDVYSMPFLDPENDEKFNLYREQYADILYTWGLSINRIKILKFNFPSYDTGKKEYDSSKTPFKIHESHFGLRQLERNSSIGSKDCNFCGLSIKKRLFLCNSCEHILHSSCATEWWQESEECPSGCGCRCLDNI